VKNTIEELAKNQFGIDVEIMPIMEPINISEANIGIKSYNFKKKKDEFSRVLFIIKKEKSKMLNIAGKDFNVTVGCDHLFFISDDCLYADKLKIGDILFGNKKIDSIEETDFDYVYDLQTENENYYVNGILGHNTPMSHLPSVTGGEAPQFYSSTINRVTKVDVIKDAVDTIGQQIRVRNYKNKTSVPFRDAEMNLYFTGGFKPEEEYLDFIIKFDIFKQGGAWFTNEEYNVKLNGRAKVQEWLNQNPEPFNKMKIQVDDLLSHANILDANNKDPNTEELKPEDEIPEDILNEEEV
jgi:hypothetical protein